MDTKKTIFVSMATTLVTMFVVAVLMHMCGGNCHKGSSSCQGKAKAHCSYEKSSCKKSSCDAYSGCTASAKSCKSKSSCHKKSKCSKGKKCSSKTSCSKGKNGEHIVKKVVKVEVEDEE
jgi:hypothetical protein